MISVSARFGIAGDPRAVSSRRFTSCKPRPYPAPIHWKDSLIFRKRGRRRGRGRHIAELGQLAALIERHLVGEAVPRSEEHTSELQSRQYLVCRLLLEKKKQQLKSAYRWRDRFSQAFHA